MTAEYPTAYQEPAVNTPKRKRPQWMHIVGYTLTAGAFLGIGVGIGAGSSADANLAAPAPVEHLTQAVPGPTVTTHDLAAGPVAKPTPTAKPAPVKATIQDGYSVDIPGDAPAGRYSARSDSTDCYWEIDKTSSPSDIVDNGGFIKGHITVTLKRGQTFQSSSCGDWTQQ